MTAAMQANQALAEMPLSEAAHRLGLRYQAALDAVLIGRLVGRKAGRFWMVEAKSVERLQRERTAAGSAA